MTIKTVHDAFAFITVVVPWASAAVFLAVVGLLFRREQECAVAAETGRAELQAIGSLLESDNSKTGLISLKVLNARSSFAVLQVLDLLTTLLAFHVGAFEVNPLIAHLMALFGRVGGVVLGKGIALILALGVRKRLWIVNLFYVGVICWNLFVLIALAVRRH